MGDSRYYRRIKQQKVARGAGKPMVPLGGGLYVHPLWAKWLRIGPYNPKNTNTPKEPQ